MNYKRIVELLGWFAVGYAIHRIGQLSDSANDRSGMVLAHLSLMSKRLDRLEKSLGTTYEQEVIRRRTEGPVPTEPRAPITTFHCPQCDGVFYINDPHPKNECRDMRRELGR